MKEDKQKKKTNKEPRVKMKTAAKGIAVMVPLAVVFVCLFLGFRQPAAETMQPQSEAESAFATEEYEDVFAGNASDTPDGNSPDALGENTPEESTEISGESTPGESGESAQEPAECKDYLQEGRNRLYMYELLGVDPCSPQKMEPEVLQRKLNRFAGKSGEFAYIAEHQELYPLGLVAATCLYPEMIDFTLGYPEHEDEVNAYTEAELAEDYPLLLQWDRRWGYKPYGASCVAMSGCAPTCLAMVILELTGQTEFTPDVIGDFAMEKGYYMPGTGTLWTLMSEGAAQFGLEAIQLKPESGDGLRMLQEGYPVICSVRPGNFTSQGHFILLTGWEDGYVTVNDPNSIARSSMQWEYETVRRQVKGMWAYTMPGAGLAARLLP